MNGESSMETYTLPYVKQTTSGNLMYDAGNQKSVLCDNLEGWGGVGWGGEGGGGQFRREGTQVCLWPIHVDVWQKPSQYCKVIIIKLK